MQHALSLPVTTMSDSPVPTAPHTASAAPSDADARRALMTQRIEALCRYIDAHADQPLTLDALAERAALSRFHLQRRFKAVTGVSPRQYLEAARLRLLKSGLRDQPSGRVTDAIVEAGYGSPSRVYERIATHLGMTPRQYRDGGRGTAISYVIDDSALGPLLMAATDRGLCFVHFGDEAAGLLQRLRDEYPQADLQPMPDAARPQFAAWMAALTAHLRGDGASAPAASLALDLRGTAFQMKVWDYLLRIPSGELRSYTEVAAAIGHPSAVRAVASACAANRVGVLVPCHRVIRGDGGLGGYRWGLERKRALIDIERRPA